jgi:DNA ligase-1
MPTLPILYKKTKAGAIEQWEIRHDDFGYTITHGQVGGIKQHKSNVVKGKNIGKSNETSTAEQAESEALSRWKKQIDKGYSQDIQKLEFTKPKPMLAHKFSDHGDKITYPCYVQPKLDGVRCLAYLKDNKVVLLSRQGKPYNVPHIQKTLKDVFETLEFDGSYVDKIILDGELYIHGVPFQNLVSWIKKEQPDTAKIEYHIYDIVTDEAFAERLFDIDNLFAYVVSVKSKVRQVETFPADNADQIYEHHSKFLELGYEGSIIRYGDKGYEIGYRSKYLLKMKEFIDGEFEIVGAEQDKNKPKECTFLLVTENGAEFRCKCEGSQPDREQMWLDYQNNPGDFVGKFLTVRYFEMTTSENPVPRFPVGVSIDRWSYE